MFVCCTGCRRLLEVGDAAFHCLDCAGVVFCRDCYAREGAAHGHLMVLEERMRAGPFWRQLAWCRSVGSIYYYALHRFAGRPLFGVRCDEQEEPPKEIEERHESRRRAQELGPVDGFRESGPWGPLDAALQPTRASIHWLTYQGALAMARACGAALRRQLPEAARIGLCAPNSPQWVCVDLGCAFYGLPVVPFDAALSDEHIVGLLDEAEIEALVVEQASMPRFRTLLADCPALRFLIAIDEASDIRHVFDVAEAFGGDRGVGQDAPPTSTDGWEEETLSGLVRRGVAAPLPLTPTLEEELFTIACTSGSTGRPKGVIFSGKSWRQRFCREVSLSPGVVVSFQPLSFASARSNLFISLVNGGRIGFHEGREIEGIFSTFQLFRPSMIISVPRLWNQIYADYQAALGLARLQAKMEADAASAGREPTGPLAATPKSAVETELPERALCLREELRVEAVLEAKVVAGFRGLLGGRTQLLLSGGAPIAPAVLAFLERCFGCRAGDGYGITECGSLTTEDVLKEGVSYRLTDAPELGYTRADRPYPRGELWVKSEAMADGYVHEESDTPRFVDGWFRTGDIVALLAPRKLRVIDRRAHVTKLAQGVFVSPEQLEQAYQTCPLVSQIYIHCESLRSEVMALVVPNLPVLAAALGFVENAPGRLDESEGSAPLWFGAHRDAALALLRRALADIAEEVGFRSFERPRALALAWMPFTIANQMLTSTSKLSRLAIARYYRAELAALAEALDSRDKGSLEAQILSIIQAHVRGQAPERNAADAKRRALAIDSLSALSIRAQVLAQCQIDLPLEGLLAAPDLDALLAQVLAPTNASRSAIRDDLREDLAQLARPTTQTPAVVGAGVGSGAATATSAGLRAESPTPAGVGCGFDAAPVPSGQDLLLTGATGFLGPHLLASLLAQYPKATIVCMIRAADGSADTGRKRLEAACRAQGVWSQVEQHKARLEVCVGDLAAPQLGLQSATLEALSRQICLIVHSAALVNHALPYRRLHEANVNATDWFLRWAEAIGASYLLVSSTSAVSAQMWALHGRSDTAERLAERTLEQWVDLHKATDGYSMSKAMAEAALGEAHQRGVRAQVVRPGYVGGDGQGGASNPAGFVELLLGGCWAMGAFPIVPEGAGINVIPVDSVAKAIAALTLVWPPEGAPCQVTHLYHPDPILPWATLFAALQTIAAGQGQQLLALPHGQWWQCAQAHCQRLVEAGQPDILGALLPLWRERLPDQHQRPWPAPTGFQQRLPDGLPEVWSKAAVARWVNAIVALQTPGP